MASGRPSGSGEKSPDDTAASSIEERLAMGNEHGSEMAKEKSKLESSVVTPMPQPPVGPPPPPAAKQGRPTLLKPQYKTALKDFIVSLSTLRIPNSSAQYLAHHILAYLFLLDMAGQGVAPCRGVDVNRGRRHHARDEYHFRYDCASGCLLSHKWANWVVGRMVNSFTGYFSQDASTTYEMFNHAISTCA